MIELEQIVQQPFEEAEKSFSLADEYFSKRDRESFINLAGAIEENTKYIKDKLTIIVGDKSFKFNGRRYDYEKVQSLKMAALLYCLSCGVLTRGGLSARLGSAFSQYKDIRVNNFVSSYMHGTNGSNFLEHDSRFTRVALTKGVTVEEDRTVKKTRVIPALKHYYAKSSVQRRLNRLIKCS